MIEPKLKFGLYALLLGVLFAFSGEFVFRHWYPEKFFLGFYFVVAFLCITTIFFHVMLVAASESRPALFVNRFVAFTGMKLLLYLMVILIYVFFVKNQQVSFLLTFLCGYFVFTIFEITSILNFLRKKSK